jgi:hypothetical protein
VPVNTSVIMYDLFTNPDFHDVIVDVIQEQRTFLSGVADLDFLMKSTILSNKHEGEPRLFALSPVFKDLIQVKDVDQVVGFLAGIVPWYYFLEGHVDNRQPPMNVDVTGCGSSFSYSVQGHSAIFLGESKFMSQEGSFTKMAISAEFAPAAQLAESIRPCHYNVTVSPTQEFMNHHETNEPLIYTIIIMAVFVLTSMVFIAYDCNVTLRHNKLVTTTKRTNDIVKSLFPAEVQERMMEEAKAVQAMANGGSKTSSATSQLKNGNIAPYLIGKPNADLFPEATVLFCDIVGFT